MKNDFKALNKRISELTQQSNKASARSQLFALQAQTLAIQARAHLYLLKK